MFWFFAMPFTELSATSNFTFLTGASHPEDYVLRAVELGFDAIAIADVNSVAGIVRAHTKARESARDGGAGEMVLSIRPCRQFLGAGS